jgi:hypothetical protein
MQSTILVGFVLFPMPCPFIIEHLKKYNLDVKISHMNTEKNGIS